MFYLDDVTLEGDLEDFLHDLEVVDREAAVSEWGLRLNRSKSDVTCRDQPTRNSILSPIPGARVVDPQDACLLGSPIDDSGSVSDTFDEKIRLLGIVGGRLQHLEAHDVILLLHHSFAIPKLLYTLPVFSLPVASHVMRSSDPPCLPSPTSISLLMTLPGSKRPAELVKPRHLNTEVADSYHTIHIF